MKSYSPRAAALLLAATPVALCLLVPAAFATGPPEVVIRPAPQRVPPLTAEEKKRIRQAIDPGVSYLKRTQLPTGSWVVSKDDWTSGDISPSYYAAGFAGLGGLALLESGVPTDDTAVQGAARFILLSGPRLHRTYDVTLALLFLDRLGDSGDRPLIRSLALRLAAGQTALGGRSYDCPLLNSGQEKKLEQALRKKKRADLPKQLRPPPPSRPGQVMSSDPADNSNTQFALLALGAARKHELPLDYTLGLVELRFRLSENAAGWEYRWVPSRVRGYGSMTCAGLLALAVGRAAAEEKPTPEGKEEQTRPEDAGIAWGLKILGAYLRYPSDIRAGASLGPRVNGRATSPALNLYYLWSVERVGVLCGVDTIGGADWYSWRAGLLLPAQRPDGSWLGGGSLGYSVADTCFALLFLRRSDLLPELRKVLARRVRVVDPGPFTPADLAKKGGKGPRPDPKGKETAGTPAAGSPGGKGAAAQEGPLAVDLGAVPTGRPVERLLRVRGPAPFRITGVRGGDSRLKAQAGSSSAAAHDLTLTLQLDKAGAWEGTLYLQTDLPGRAEVPVRVRARATAAPGSGR